jgi:hypothetical protein
MDPLSTLVRGATAGVPLLCTRSYVWAALRRPVRWRRRREPESRFHGDAPRAKHLGDDGVVMNRVAHHEHQLACDRRARRDHRAAVIELCFDEDLAFEQRWIESLDGGYELRGGAHGCCAIGLDAGVAFPPIIRTQTGVGGRQQGAHMIETVTDVSADAP